STAQTTHLSNTEFVRSRAERGDFQRQCWISFSAAAPRTIFHFAENILSERVRARDPQVGEFEAELLAAVVDGDRRGLAQEIHAEEQRQTSAVTIDYGRK